MTSRALGALACALAVATALASVADLRCFYNGQYNASSQICACLPGWAGPDCRTLSLLPAPPLATSNQTYYHPSDAAAAPNRWVDNSWGISALPGDGDGLWHGYMTELAGNCSLSSYSLVSRILHVTSASPLGPWEVQGVALPAFAHNPNVVRDVTGAWLLFHIGSELPDCTVKCATGRPVYNGTCTGVSKGTSVARATSPYGPWQRVPYITVDNATNPAAVVFANGTIVVTTRRWTGGVPLYVSTEGWQGPYEQQPLLPVTVYPAAAGTAGVEKGAAGEDGQHWHSSDVPLQPAVAAGGSSSNTTFFDEDPFLFINALGYAHMLTHRQPSGVACSATGSTPDDCRCAGGHLFAPTVFGPWYADPQSIFNCTLEVEVGAALQDGGADAHSLLPRVAGPSSGIVTLHARQRPTLHFPETPGPGVDPVSAGCPVLFTGASTDPVSQYDSSFTMAQPVQCT